MLVLGAFPNLAEARVVAVLFAALRVPARGLKWPSAQGQIQTLVQAGGIAKALIRFSVSGSESLDPSARVYVNPFPAFLRWRPGRASETYLRPADSAASFGSTIASALSAQSTNKTESLRLRPKSNLFESGSTNRCRSGGAPMIWLRHVVQVHDEADVPVWIILRVCGAQNDRQRNSTSSQV